MPKKHPAPGIEAPATKAIVFERSHPSYGHNNAGDRVELAKQRADLLVSGGFARFDAAETAVAPTDETR